MFLVIDTESNGLFDYKRSAEAAEQPRLVEFAAILVDANGDKEEEFQRYILPDGWKMTPEATEVNGITDEMLREKGVPVAEVLDFYTTQILSGRAVVAFAAQHDCKIMRGELRRREAIRADFEHRAMNEEADLFTRTPNVCLMRQARPFAKTIGRELVKAGANNKGWPKLTDLMNFLGVIYDPTSLHGALADCRGAEACFRLMLDQGFQPEPTVYFSKDAIKGAQ